jgi:predicted lysophospholipase L1 biosynthesis ABC-type transport system permease subunit
MDQNKEHLDNLLEIRSLMERSSRFISLSGLSGILAGSFALIGALAAYLYLKKNYFNLRDPYISFDKSEVILFLLGDAMIVLVLALASGVFFSLRQAKKKEQKIWDHTSKRLFINLAIPLAAGGFFFL